MRNRRATNLSRRLQESFHASLLFLICFSYPPQIQNNKTSNRPRAQNLRMESLVMSKFSCETFRMQNNLFINQKRKEKKKRNIYFLNIFNFCRKNTLKTFTCCALKEMLDSRLCFYRNDYLSLFFGKEIINTGFSR